MICNGCGNKYAARVRINYIAELKKSFEQCDECAHVPPVWLPDVYLEKGGGARTNENLCDENGKPYPYSSKREKAVIMKMLKVRESGEHNHGSRNESHLHRKTYFT